MHERVVMMSVSKTILWINFVLEQAYTQRALFGEKYQWDSAVAILLPFRTKTTATATTIQTIVFCLAEVEVSIFHSLKFSHIDVSIHIDRFRSNVCLWLYKGFKIDEMSMELVNKWSAFDENDRFFYCSAKWYRKLTIRVWWCCLCAYICVCVVFIEKQLNENMQSTKKGRRRRIRRKEITNFVIWQNVCLKNTQISWKKSSDGKETEIYPH